MGAQSNAMEKMLNIAIRSKAYIPEISVIKNLLFSVNKNEIVALIGPSGAGKSTLLNLIAGIDNEFDGEIITSLPDMPKIGLMFQDARLMPWLTVLENIQMVADSSQSKVNASHILNSVGLAEYQDAYPAQLSGGISKRVALARAFVFNPNVLLMDEPFSSLDVPSAEQLRQTLLLLQKQTSSSIVYVTHDLSEAVSIADRILFLSAKPMTLIEQVSVTLPRPRSLHDPEVAKMCQFFYTQYPDLLCAQASR